MDSPKEISIGKTKVINDGFYSNQEMQKVRDEVEKNSALQLDNLGANFESWVNTEVSGSNIRHLNKLEYKGIIDELKDLLIKKFGTDFNQDQAKNPIYLLQFILKHEYGLTGKNGSDLQLDGKFGINTFIALINFQRNDIRYTTEVSKVETATSINEFGRPDGVANGRTLEAFLIKLREENKSQQEPVSVAEEPVPDELILEPVEQVTNGNSSNVFIHDRVQNDNVGATDVVDEKKAKKFEITMNPSQLKEEVRKKIEELPADLKNKVEKVMKAMPAYSTLYSLMIADGERFGNEKEYEGYTGYFKYWNRYIDKSPVYYGSMKNRFEAKQNDIQNKLVLIGQKITEGDVQGLAKVVNLINNEFSSLSDDIVQNIGNFSYYSEESQKSSLKKEVMKYQNRLDDGDKFAAYEFMSRVMKNDLYNLGAVVNNFNLGIDDKHLTDLLINDSDEGVINSKLNGKQFTLFGKTINIPNNDYSKIIIKARKDSLNSYNKVDETYVMQILITSILKGAESDVMNSLKGNEGEKYVKLMYENDSILNELGKHWTSYTIKGLMVGATMYGAGSVAGAASGRLGLNGGIGLASDLALNTAIITPIIAIETGIMNGRGVLDSTSDLLSGKLWLESAAMIGTFTVVSRVLAGIGNLSQVERMGGTITSVPGGRFLLSGVNFGVEVGSMIGVNNLVFDGEFTAEEIVNAIMYVAFMRGTSNSFQIKKTPKGEIRISQEMYNVEGKFGNKLTPDQYIKISEGRHSEVIKELEKQGNYNKEIEKLILEHQKAWKNAKGTNMTDNYAHYDKPKVVEAEPVPGKPEPKVVEAEPVPGKPEPKVGEAEPVPGKPEPKVGEAEPVPGKPEPKVGEAEPVPGKPEPKVGEAEPVPGKPEPKVGEAEPVPGKPEPKVGEAEPVPGKPEPKVGEAEPVHGKPEPRTENKMDTFEPKISKEFTFPENSTFRNYKVEIAPNGEQKIYIKNSKGKFQEASGTELPTGFMRDFFNDRVVNELKSNKVGGKIKTDTLEPNNSKEFTFPENSTFRNYKVEIAPNGEQKIFVKNTEGKFVEASGTELPTGFMKDHFDARVANELKSNGIGGEKITGKSEIKGPKDSVEKIVEKEKIDFEVGEIKDYNINMLPKEKLIGEINKANNEIASLKEGEKIYLGTKTDGNYLEITKTSDGYQLQAYNGGNIDLLPVLTNQKLEIKISEDSNYIVPEISLNYGVGKHYGNIKEVLFKID